MSRETMLECAISAAKQAGDYAKAQTGKAKVDLKTDDQLVTSADRRCQEMIVEKIREMFAEDGIIGEEGPQGGLFKERPSGDSDRWWCIDPIDGTRNYVHGLPGYAVSIGVIEKGLPVLGVIYDPNTGDLYSGSEGMGAFCNGLEIHCSQGPLDKNSQFGFSGNVLKRQPKLTEELMDRFTLMNVGSAALHYCYVSIGGYVGAFGWDVKLWDVAAGAAICLAAGGHIWDLNGNPRFPIDCHKYKGQSVDLLMAGEKTGKMFFGLLKSAG